MTKYSATNIPVLNNINMETENRLDKSYFSIIRLCLYSFIHDYVCCLSPMPGIPMGAMGEEAQNQRLRLLEEVRMWHKLIY